jgi:hypothetical protein
MAGADDVNEHPQDRANQGEYMTQSQLSDLAKRYFRLVFHAVPYGKNQNRLVENSICT